MTSTKSPEHAHIHSRMDQLTAIADLRKAQASDIHVSLLGGAGVSYLNREELIELHELKLKLPTYAQDRKEAQVRIRERLNKRRGLYA